MEATEAKQLTINYHLGKILQEIKELAEKGVFEKRYNDLTPEQFYLLKKLGFYVDEYNRNFNPLRHCCTINWVNKPKRRDE